MYAVKFVTKGYLSPGRYGLLTYLPGDTVEVIDYDAPDMGQCARGIHVIPIAPDANFTNALYGERLILLEVEEEDILYREGNGKMRVRKAHVKGDIADFPEHLNAFLQSPEGAYRYAQCIAKQADDITRKAACRHPNWALRYACDIDEGPRDDTREAACQDAWTACDYADCIDKAPRDDTRKAACGEPRAAYNYAIYVDKGPHEETRKASCGKAAPAYLYAAYVDKEPRDDTRRAACQDAHIALQYALDVDKAPHPDTRQAVAHEIRFRANYDAWLGTGE